MLSPGRSVVLRREVGLNTNHRVVFSPRYCFFDPFRALSNEKRHGQIFYLDIEGGISALTSSQEDRFQFLGPLSSKRRFHRRIATQCRASYTNLGSCLSPSNPTLQEHPSKQTILHSSVLVAKRLK